MSFQPNDVYREQKEEQLKEDYNKGLITQEEFDRLLSEEGESAEEHEDDNIQ